ncbi:MAG: type IV conjugative transfer system protein TraL [Candidatus Micrarchaeia archaeon]
MKYKIPQYLHRQVQVLWFELDEIVLINILLILAMIFGYVFWLLLFLVPFVFSKLKKNKARGYLRHILYMIGVVNIKNVPYFTEKIFQE